MSFASKVKGIITKYSDIVVLMKPNKHVRCSCFSETFHESSARCHLCFGKGYLPLLEAWHGRQMDMDYRIFDAPGLYTAFFLPEESHVSAGNWVIEVQWENKYPKSIIDKHEITAVNLQKYIAGQPVFYKAVGHRQNIENHNDDAILDMIREQIKR